MAGGCFVDAFQMKRQACVMSSGCISDGRAGHEAVNYWSTIRFELDSFPTGARMTAPVANSGTVRFGAFEADLRSGELRKDSIKVKLEGQPFQVLAALLERPGQLVTREELQKELWPNETFVDFEKGINAAVKRLRLALGDSTEKPRFIETLPRRGYRFIAP